MPSLNLEAKLRPHLLASVAYFDAEKSAAAVNNSLKYIFGRAYYLELLAAACGRHASAHFHLLSFSAQRSMRSLLSVTLIM